MRSLPRFAAVFFAMACSSEPSSSGFLRISMHTGDLFLPDDTDRVGLYIAQSDQEGRMRNVLAYEATPLVEPGQAPRIRFPADLIVVSRGEADRVHARLVAFKRDTHEALTMREARVQVPIEDGKGIRLNLFFVNQSNVRDRDPGAPLLSGAVQLMDQGGSISLDAFERFGSVCNGAPAPDGMTAGDDGSCVPLDVPNEALVEPAELDRGTRSTDGCYDVTRAFARAQPGDAEVPQIDARTLPASGDCRLPLPGQFDPARLNVAMKTSEAAFRDPLGGALRPLPAQLAFRLEGNTLVLPARICDLARRPEVSALLFSQRTEAWGGGEPVCSDWALAKGEGSYDGGAPTPLPDGAPDADPVPEPELSEYEVSARGSITGFAARNGAVALLTSRGGPSGPHELLRVARSQFDVGGEVTTESNALSGATGVSAPILKAIAASTDPTSAPNFYAQPVEGGLFSVGPGASLDSVSGAPPSLRVLVEPLGARAVALWSEGAAVTIGELETGGIVPLLEYSSSAQIELPSQLAARDATRFIVPNPQRPHEWLDCQFESCETKEVSPFSIPSARGAVYVAPNMFGFVLDSTAPQLIDYDTSTVQALPTGYELPAADIVPLGATFCAVYAAPPRVRCSSAAQVQSGEAGHALLGGADSVRLMGDERSLYLAYQCSSETPLRIARVRADAVQRVPGLGCAP